MQSGGYGCCPYDRATCCEDKQSCCPGGYTCKVSEGMCVKQQGSNEFLAYVGLMEKLEATEQVEEKVEGVADIIKCFKDLIPVYNDVKELVKDIENKDMDAITKLLPVILKDGLQMTADCKSLFESLIQ